MTVLADHVDERSEAYQANRTHLLELLAEHDRQLALVNGGGGEKYVARHRQRGKLLARERVELLIDRRLTAARAVAAGRLGHRLPGRRRAVHGRRRDRGTPSACSSPTTPPSAAARAPSPRCARTCGRWRSPGRTGSPSSTWSSRAAPTCPTRARSSSPAVRASTTSPSCRRWACRRSPSCSATRPPAGAYVPGMSDYVVMIDQRSKVFLGGPPLVKMATGEESDDESLGGADMHARVSGLADHFAVDELDALRIGRAHRRAGSTAPARPRPPAAGPPAALRPRAAPRHHVGRPARAVRPA